MVKEAVRRCSRCLSERPASAFIGKNGSTRRCCAKCRSSVSAQNKRSRENWRADLPLQAASPAAPAATASTRPPPTFEALLKEDVRRLTAEVTRLRANALTEERVRRELLGLAHRPMPKQPAWSDKLSPEGSLGTAILFLSDQHLGEVVDPDQVGGVNTYNMEIAKRRWRHVVTRAISLCYKHLAKAQYDGVVCALGGDGISGDIHDELSKTNELESGEAALELASLISWTGKELAKAFGKVFMPCVIGNHPRMTHKPRAKGAAFSNFDWLAYQLASRELSGEKRVQMLIPTGLDARFDVSGHRFNLTHGNQFRGGDGIIGPLGPVFRGDAKKRAVSAQIGQSYDTLMIGHFHQLRMDNRVVMNGSLKGYDEWAMSESFPYEPPRQALFVVHPRYGITFSMPVLAEEPKSTG